MLLARQQAVAEGRNLNTIIKAVSSSIITTPEVVKGEVDLPLGTDMVVLRVTEAALSQAMALNKASAAAVVVAVTYRGRKKRDKF
jgi:hypothetical protein